MSIILGTFAFVFTFIASAVFVNAAILVMAEVFYNDGPGVHFIESEGKSKIDWNS